MNRYKYFFYFLTASVIVFCIILSLVPPVSRDALTHHLYVPYLYLKYGGMVEIPHISFSYYPELLDLLYCIPLFFKNDILPKYIHFFFALLTAFFIYRYLKSRLGEVYALIGVLFFLTIPVILKLSVTVYVDLGLVFFTFASIYYLFEWRKNKYKLRFLIISGIFSGLALGVKYNALVSFLSLTLFVPYLSSDKIKKSWKVFTYPLIFVAISISVFSPWMIRNYIWTDNPIYPLYENVFNGHSKEKSDPIDNDFYFGKGMNHFLMRKVVYGESPIETLLTPVRIFFQGEDENPKLFDGKLNPFLFILPCIVVFLRKKLGKNEKEVFFLLFFSILTLLIVFLKSDMRIRYAVVIVPPLVVVSMYGLKIIEELIYEKFNIKYSLQLILIFIFAGNFFYIGNLFLKVKPFDYIRGKVSRADYISMFRPEYRLIDYLNKNSSENSKVLAVFLGHRGYYFKREVRFRRDILYHFVKNSDNPLNLLHELSKLGYTHILLRYDLFLKDVKNTLSDREKSMVEVFFNQYCSLLGNSSPYMLYKLGEM